MICLYLGWGNEFIVLLDSDSAGIKEKKRYIELFGKSVEDILVTYEDINNSLTNFETEDLFSSSDKLKIQTTNYPTETSFKKKTFNRSIQENYAIGKTITLKKETTDNFKMILDFIKEKLK